MQNPVVAHSTSTYQTTPKMDEMTSIPLLLNDSTDMDGPSHPNWRKLGKSGWLWIANVNTHQMLIMVMPQDTLHHTCGMTSTIWAPLLTVTGSFASTLSRWFYNSLACHDPKSGLANWWCQTSALSLYSLYEPSVLSVYSCITGSATSFHSKVMTGIYHSIALCLSHSDILCHLHMPAQIPLISPPSTFSNKKSQR